jgi:hypothetical protein
VHGGGRNEDGKWAKGMPRHTTFPFPRVEPARFGCAKLFVNARALQGRALDADLLPTSRFQPRSRSISHATLSFLLSLPLGYSLLQHELAFLSSSSLHSIVEQLTHQSPARNVPSETGSLTHTKRMSLDLANAATVCTRHLSHAVHAPLSPPSCEIED